MWEAMGHRCFCEAGAAAVTPAEAVYETGLADTSITHNYNFDFSCAMMIEKIRNRHSALRDFIHNVWHARSKSSSSRVAVFITRLLKQTSYADDRVLVKSAINFNVHPKAMFLSFDDAKNLTRRCF